VFLENYWPAYFLNYYIRCRVFGKRSPVLAGFKITHKCNLNCQHCPFWKKPERTTLSFQKVGSILQSLRESGIRIIIFEGGEPFLWKDGRYTIHDVVREAKKYFFSVGLVTNGTFPLDIPTDVLWVSIDGLHDTNSRIRGSLYKNILQHIENSRHANLLVNITINDLNHKEIPALVKYFTGKVRGFTIQFYYPYDGDHTLCLSAKDRSAVLQELLNLKQEGYSILDSAGCLKALQNNSWRCEDWMIANAEPDGQINMGCYVKNRAEVNCSLCGFAAHAEISQAFQLKLAPLLAGIKIFKYRNLGRIDAAFRSA
jgi:MoaA/NifB/PqqE/SkfB family radical SAM enzyme